MRTAPCCQEDKIIQMFKNGLGVEAVSKVVHKEQLKHQELTKKDTRALVEQTIMNNQKTAFKSQM